MEPKTITPKISMAENVEFLDVAGAAAFLGVSPKTLYAWSMRKLLPYYKAGRLNRYKKSDLLAFLESSKIDKC